MLGPTLATVSAHSTPPPPSQGGFQRVTNECWPYRHPETGEPHARPELAPVETMTPFGVEARVVFEHDGEVILRGRAARWANGSTFVQIDDRRLQIRGAWLRDRDVRRA